MPITTMEQQRPWLNTTEEDWDSADGGVLASRRRKKKSQPRQRGHGSPDRGEARAWLVQKGSTDTPSTVAATLSPASSLSKDEVDTTNIPPSYLTTITSAFGQHVDLYQLLQVPNDASPRDIRIAYFRRGRQVLTTTSSAEDQTRTDQAHSAAVTIGGTVPESAKLRFQAVSMAYEILSRPTWREIYDVHGLGVPEDDLNIHYYRYRQNSPDRFKKNTSRRCRSAGVRWNEEVEELVFDNDPSEFSKLDDSDMAVDGDDFEEDRHNNNNNKKTTKKKKRNAKKKKRVVLEMDLEELDQEAANKDFMHDFLDDLEASIDSFFRAKKGKAIKSDDDDISTSTASNDSRGNNNRRAAAAEHEQDKDIYKTQQPAVHPKRKASPVKEQPQEDVSSLERRMERAVLMAKSGEQQPTPPQAENNKEDKPENNTKEKPSSKHKDNMDPPFANILVKTKPESDRHVIPNHNGSGDIVYEIKTDSDTVSTMSTNTFLSSLAPYRGGAKKRIMLDRVPETSPSPGDTSDNAIAPVDCPMDENPCPESRADEVGDIPWFENDELMEAPPGTFGLIDTHTDTIATPDIECLENCCGLLEDKPIFKSPARIANEAAAHHSSDDASITSSHEDYTDPTGSPPRRESRQARSSPPLMKEEVSPIPKVPEASQSTEITSDFYVYLMAYIKAVTNEVEKFGTSVRNMAETAMSPDAIWEAIMINDDDLNSMLGILKKEMDRTPNDLDGQEDESRDMWI